MIYMKVLLVNPPYTCLRGSKEATEMLVPLGLLYIGAYLRKDGIEAVLYDANYNANERLYRYGSLNKLIANYDNYSANIRSADEQPVWDECRRRIEFERPDVVGITVMSPLRGAAFRLAKICKEADPEIKVVLGGFHPTGYPEDIFRSEHVDAVVLT